VTGYPYSGAYQASPQSQLSASRPGQVLAAAVLGFVAAGLILIAALVLIVGASSSDPFTFFRSDTPLPHGELGFGAFLDLIMAGLLIAGGVVACGGRNRGRLLYTLGGGLAVADAVYWLVRGGGTSIGLVILLVAPVVVGLSLIWVRGCTQWLAAMGSGVA
jgi:hypothetical protein